MYRLPFETLQNERIILYGAGNVGVDFHDQIVSSGICTIAKWVDINGDNRDVIVPDKNHHYIWESEEKILIALKDRRITEGICETLHDTFGVSTERFIWEDYEIIDSLPTYIEKMIINNCINKTIKQGGTIDVRFVGMSAEQIVDFAAVFSDYAINVNENSKLVVYGNYCSQSGNKYILKEKGRVNIAYWPGENHLPDISYKYAFTKRNLGELNNCFMTGARNEFGILEDRKLDLSIDYVNRRFCNFVYFNDSFGEGAIFRKDFCKELMKYKHVDCPGRVLNNMSNSDVGHRFGNWYINKLDFLKKYKFTIAFENKRVRGDVDEKLIQPLAVGSVPIYYGAEDVGEYLNRDCFIDTKDYDDDWTAVINKIIELDNDPEMYMYMINTSPLKIAHFSSIRKKEVDTFISRMLAKEDLLK